MDSHQYTKRSYNKWAEKMTKRSWNMRYENDYLISKFLVDNALLSKIDFDDKRVLNVGCAEPIDEVYYASRVKEWYGVDINKEIVRASKELVQKELSEKLSRRIRFQVEDASKMSFPDAYFDIVVSFSVIDHIPERENRRRAVDEMCRVLRPRGHLIITVPGRWDLRRTYISNKRQRKGEFPHGYEYQFSPLELRRMIRSNGLRILDFASTEYNPVSNVSRLFRLLRIHKPIMHFGERLGYLAQK